ncbi:MAG: hypothetical protein AAGA18_11875 [Verrucomicrobiota bacterium]
MKFVAFTFALIITLNSGILVHGSDTQETKVTESPSGKTDLNKISLRPLLNSSIEIEEPAYKRKSVAPVKPNYRPKIPRLSEEEKDTIEKRENWLLEGLKERKELQDLEAKQALEDSQANNDQRQLLLNRRDIQDSQDQNLGNKSQNPLNLNDANLVTNSRDRTQLYQSYLSMHQHSNSVLGNGVFNQESRNLPPLLTQPDETNALKENIFEAGKALDVYNPYDNIPGSPLATNNQPNFSYQTNPYKYGPRNSYNHTSKAYTPLSTAPAQNDAIELLRKQEEHRVKVMEIRDKKAAELRPDASTLRSSIPVPGSQR